MQDLLAKVDEVLLMGPGPSCVPEKVYEALRRPTLGHMDAQFIEIMDELSGSIRTLLHTKNRLTLPISGTGSAGMEAAFVNLIEPGDRVLILINGVFGKRMQDVAGRLGAEVDLLEFEWGTPVVPKIVAEKLKNAAYRIVAVVHAETSTGVRNPVEEIGTMVNASGALYLVDAVTSLGGIPVRCDEWGIDALYSGSQKCLSCPPGLAPITFSDRAIEKIRSRKSKVPNWYLDMTMIMQYWEGARRVYHHTAPINMIYALYRAAQLILEEGETAVFDRHRRNHEYLVERLSTLGLSLLVDPQYRLPMLNSVLVPEGVDEAAVRSRLRSEFKIEIGAGLGPLAGKIWRIGLMGHTAREENVDRLVQALKASL